MKFLLVIAALPALLNALSDEEVRQRADLSHRKCFKSTNANMDTVLKIRSHEFSEDDHIVRKQISCYVQEVGFMNSNGEVNKELMKRRGSQYINFAENDNERKFGDCQQAREIDVPVDLYATRVTMCMYRNFPDAFLV